ncbi:MAG: hypothetical protein HPY89_12890 [Pelotomaculum sp.]|uniref:Uncharacterized protein n=1 Tax=Pelotomaculum thermopropionicum (strain DSM 13744 / JCM 10971 / SI) TaxID=370438 RepID=A5CY70_PELTS|nr:hypothetical protein [Pelotomaculum sp.]BAF61060.1 hypothetical protein PTH_2879 [Pelotomaculum thermopropionicum SI]
MKRAWIIPVVICLLLLAAWPFRWEKGPVQSDSKAKIAHMRDRWTGQAWVALYGIANGEVYSGEMRPVPSQADIAKRKEQILASPEEVQKRQELEKKLAEYEEIKEQYKWANAKYDELINENMEKIRKETLELRKQQGRFIPLDFSDEKLNKGIPQDIINAHELTVNTAQNERKIRGELDNQQKWAEDTARSEFMCWAWRKRNIATGVWAGLVVLSAIMAVILFIRASRSRHDQGVSTL